MNKSGAGLSIEKIVLLIIGAIVLAVVVVWIVQSWNRIGTPIKEKGNEFVGRLDDLSLSELKQQVKENPGSIMNKLFEECNAGKVESCQKYISICGEGVDPTEGPRKFTKEELTILQDHCNGLDAAKEKLKEIGLKGAEELYERYLDETNNDALRAELSNRLVKDYPNSKYAILVQLLKKPKTEFEQDASKLLISALADKDYETVLRIGEIYELRAKQEQNLDTVNLDTVKGYKIKAANAYSEIINRRQEVGDELYASALLRRAGVVEGRGGYGQFYLEVDNAEELKSLFGKTKLFAELSDRVVLEAEDGKAERLKADFKITSTLVKEPGYVFNSVVDLRKGESAKLQPFITISEDDPGNDPGKVNAGFAALELNLGIFPVGGLAGYISECNYDLIIESYSDSLSRLNNKQFSLSSDSESKLYCKDIIIVLKDINPDGAGFGSPPYPISATVEMELKWQMAEQENI